MSRNRSNSAPKLKSFEQLLNSQKVEDISSQAITQQKDNSSRLSTYYEKIKMIINPDRQSPKLENLNESQFQSEINIDMTKLQKIQVRENLYFNDEANENYKEESQVNHNIEEQINQYKLMVESQECLLCCQEKQIKQFSSIFLCAHQFCDECLINYSSTLIKSRQLIRCPDCQQQLNEELNLENIINKLNWKKYQKYKFVLEVEKNEKLRLCPNPQCQRGTIEIKNINKKSGKCSECSNIYCLDCMLLNHLGKCRNSAQKMMKRKFNYQRCPKCCEYIEKSSGCPHITCRCGQQFCYYCGGKWLGGLHKCMRLKIGQDQLMSDKIAKSCKCLRTKDYDDDYGMLGYILTIPYGFIYSLLMILWIVWCSVWFLVFFVVTVIGCLFIGYPYTIKQCIQNFHFKNRVKLILAVCILLAPLAIIITWVCMSVYIIKDKFSRLFLQPCFGGYLFPILKGEFN